MTDGERAHSTRAAATEQADRLAAPTLALSRLACLSTVCRHLYTVIHDAYNDAVLWKPWVHALTYHDAIADTKPSSMSWKNYAIWIVGWDGRDRGRTNFSPSHRQPLSLQDRLVIEIEMPQTSLPFRMVLGNSIGSVTQVLGGGRFLLLDQVVGLRLFEAGKPPLVLHLHGDRTCKHLSEYFSCQPGLLVEQNHESNDSLTVSLMGYQCGGWDVRRRWHIHIGHETVVYRMVGNEEGFLVVQMDRHGNEEENIASRLACFLPGDVEPIWELSLADFNDLGDDFVHGRPGWWIESFQLTPCYLICLVRNRCFFDARKGLFRILSLPDGKALHTAQMGHSRWEGKPFHPEQIRDFLVTPRHIIYAKRTSMFVVNWLTLNGSFSFYVLPTPFPKEAKQRNTGKTLFMYISMCVDEAGRILYAVTSHGWLIAWDLWRMCIVGAFRPGLRKAGPQAIWLVGERGVKIYEQKKKSSTWIKQIRGKLVN